MTFDELPFSVYDCFTDKIFGGNIGVVVWNSKLLTDFQMQKFAKEFNAPVTGYVISSINNLITVRFFMPTSEISMCGHVTIALFTAISKNQNFEFKNYFMKTSLGVIEVDVEKRKDEIPIVKFSLDLPISIKANINLVKLANSLNLELKDINSFTPVEVIDSGLKHLFVNLGTEQKVRSLYPNFEKLKIISNELNIHTIACFAYENNNEFKDLTIRDFCPALGVNETPASGTTCGALSGYLLKNNIIKPESQSLIIDQGYEIGRQSTIIVDIKISNYSINNLKVGGSAVPSYSGNIKLFK